MTKTFDEKEYIEINYENNKYYLDNKYLVTDKKDVIKEKTKFIPLKANVDEEIIQAKKELNKYNLEIKKQETFYLPKENSLRNILVIEKRNW